MPTGGRVDEFRVVEGEGSWPALTFSGNSFSGGEATIAVDGPLIPIPSWKLHRLDGVVALEHMCEDRVRSPGGGSGQSCRRERRVGEGAKRDRQGGPRRDAATVP